MKSPEEIVERALDGKPQVALLILELQNAACVFTEWFQDFNKADWPVERDRLKQMDVPESFYELAQQLARYEVKF